MKDLKKVYRAVNNEVAKDELLNLEEKQDHLKVA